MNRSMEYWALAHSIRVAPARAGIKPGFYGVVVAERNPTGWFISAGFDPALTTEQIKDFTHFVVVRTYLLLEYGPQPIVWEDDEVGVWRAECRSIVADLHDLPLIV